MINFINIIFCSVRKKEMVEINPDKPAAEEEMKREPHHKDAVKGISFL